MRTRCCCSLPCRSLSDLDDPIRNSPGGINASFIPSEFVEVTGDFNRSAHCCWALFAAVSPAVNKREPLPMFVFAVVLLLAGGSSGKPSNNTVPCGSLTLIRRNRAAAFHV